MIDAAPLNVMDESPCCMMGLGGESPTPAPLPHLLTAALRVRGRHTPCVRRWRNKATFNLSPINNVQLRRPFAKGAL